MIRIFTRSLLLLTLSMVVSAQDNTLFNQVHIDAQVEREIENDQLEVTMLIEVQGIKPDEIAASVNETMQWALKQAQSDKGIQASTRSYQTYPVYDETMITGWRSTQELYMRSTDIAGLTKMVGDLQQRLQVSQMNFTPTKQTRTNVENELISEAMLAFRQRAEIVKGHMDNMDYRIVNLQINTGQDGPVMYREAMMSVTKMADAAAPAVEAGTSKVVVTVTGSIQFF